MFPLFMLLAGVMTLCLGAFVALRSRKAATRTFALLMIAIAEWLFCMAGWGLSPTPGAAMVWFWLQFLGVSAAPVLLIIYVQTFNGRTTDGTFISRWPLWVVPAITQLLAWSNAGHRLMFRSVTFTPVAGTLALTDWDPGPWFLIHSAYSFLLIAAALVTMVRVILRSAGVFRRQLLALLIAIVPPVLLTVMNTLQLMPPDQLATPLGFVLTGGALAVAVIFYQMTNVVPIARELLIEQMDDGMLVLDERQRIIDMNPAMQALIGQQRGRLLSRPLREALTERGELYDRIVAAETAPTEVSLAGSAAPQQYEITTRTLTERGRPMGRLIVLRNITRLKAIQAELFTHATTDMLTGLYNRRQFLLLAHAQLEVAVRHRHPLAVLLFDIDRFKLINDTYGHAVGDEVLRAVARTARATLRTADILCRYGGEEFAVLLPETGVNEAYPAADRLRQAIAACRIPDQAAIAPTISVGLALYDAEHDADLELLLWQADQAMYHAKQAGRNRVMVYASVSV